MSAFPSSYALYAYVTSGWMDLTSDTVVDRIQAEWGIGENGPIDFLAETGTLTLTLDNSAGKYLPGQAGALDGWKKGTPIKLVVSYDGSDYVRFRGIVRNLSVQPGAFAPDRVYVTVVDWMERAIRYRLDYPNLMINATSDQAVQVLLDSMIIAPLATSLSVGTNVFTVIFDTIADFTKMYTELEKIALSELCYVYLRKDRMNGETLVLENANTRLAAIGKKIPKASVDCGFLLLETGDVLLLESGSKLILDESEDFTSYGEAQDYQVKYGERVINDVRFRYAPRRYHLYDYPLDSCWTSNISPGSGGSEWVVDDSIEPGETKTINSKWGWFNRTTDGDAHQCFFRNVGDEAVCLISKPFPTGFLFANMYSDNLHSTSISSDLTITSLICHTDGFSVTIHNNNVARGYLYLYMVVPPGSARVVRDAGIVATAQDATSIDENDYQPLEFDQSYQADADAGNTFVDNIFATYAGARMEMKRIDYNANMSARQMMAFLNLDVGDMLPVDHADMGISGNYFIQKFGFTIEPGGYINYWMNVTESTLSAVILTDSSTSFGSAVSSLSWMHTVSDGAYRLLVVDVSLRGSESVSGITFGGRALTLGGTKAFGATSSDPRVERWYVLSPAVGAGLVVVTLSGASFVEGVALSFVNVDQNSPFGTVVTNSGTGGTPSLTVAGARGDMVLDLIGVASGSVTPDSSQISRWNTTSDGSWRGAGSSNRGAAAVVMSWALGGASKWAFLGMAVKRVTSVTFIGSSTSTGLAVSSLSWLHTIADGNRRLLVIDVSLRGSQSVSGITFGGQALTLLGTKAFGGTSSDPKVERWYLVAPAVGIGRVTVTLSGTSFVEAAALNFVNVDQLVPFGTAVTNSGTGGTPSVTVVGETGDLMLDVIGVATGSITPDSSQVSRWNATSDTSWRGGGSSEAGAAAVGMSWTLGGANKWALLGTAIKKA